MALGLGDPYQFLSLAISPPETHSVRNALMFLDELSAVYIHDDDDDDVDKSQSPAKQNCEEKILRSQITPLGVSFHVVFSLFSHSPHTIHCWSTSTGFHLAALPINPRIGKLILFAVIMGCVEPILTIAAMVSRSNVSFCILLCNNFVVVHTLQRSLQKIPLCRHLRIEKLSILQSSTFFELTATFLLCSTHLTAGCWPMLLVALERQMNSVTKIICLCKWLQRAMMFSFCSLFR